jgi:non-heme chloroperoxidase
MSTVDSAVHLPFLAQGDSEAVPVVLLHGQRVSGLVLMGAKPTFDAADLQEFLASVEMFEDPVDPAFMREFQESTVARVPVDGIIDTAVRESAKMPARVWRALAAGALRADHAGVLGHIAAPTLLAYGDRDEFVTREDQETLLRGIPDARLRVYEGAGHAMHWEDPGEFARDLLAFVQQRVD